MANLTTAIGQENEILQEEDISFGYDSSITNVITALNTFLSGAEKNIIIGGKVEPYQTGMNVKIASLFALNKSGKYCCIDTDSIYPVAIEDSDVSQNRIDIVEIKSLLTGYDTQIRKFQDPNLDTQTSEAVYTKKKYAVDVKVKKGTAGSSSAPETDEGYIKIAEILIPSSVSAIQSSFIYNVTAIQSGEENASWTNEKDATFNPGCVYDILPKFYKAHLSDGTIKNREVKYRMIDFGVSTDQTNGNVIPNGSSISVHGNSYDNTKSSAFMISKLADFANELFKYSNDFISRYHFSSVPAVAASTENIDLSIGGSKTIDGYLCSSGVCVLLKNQDDEKENGLYKVGETWVRYPGYAISDSTTLRNTIIAVTNGNTNSGKIYLCNNDLIVTGLDNISFSETILSSKNTANTVMTRDSNGRSQVSSPVADCDIANKEFVFSTAVRQAFFDAAHPVGDIFIQYPSKGDFVTKTPEELFNVNGVTSTWGEVDYSGAFFRTNGGYSKNFGEGKQDEGLPNIKGSINAPYSGGGNLGFTGGSGAIYMSGGTCRRGNSDSSYGAYSSASFDASRGEASTTGTVRTAIVYGKSDHVTPENYTVKVWQRIY